MKINNQNFSVASTIHGWCKTAIRTQSPALSCTIGPSRVFIWRVPIGSLLFSPFFLIAYRDDFGLATLRTKALLNISHFLFLSIDLTVVCSVKVFYHIYSPTGNKQLTEIWYYTGLNQTDCHQEVTFLDPTFRHSCLVPLIRGESLYPLALRKGGRNLKLDGSTMFSLHRWLKYKWQRYLAMQTLMFASWLTLVTPAWLNFSRK